MASYCAHEPCCCPVNKKGDYCGPGCERAAKEAERGTKVRSCDCQHGACAEATGRDLDNPGSGTLA